MYGRSSPPALCPACERLVEIHPIEPDGADGWRLEMHDTSDRTMHFGQDANPAAECVMPEACTCGRAARTASMSRPRSHRWRRGLGTTPAQS